MSPGILDRQAGGRGITLAGSLSCRNAGLVLGFLSLKREIMGMATDKIRHPFDYMQTEAGADTGFSGLAGNGP